jgi:hypothetical protein
VIASAQQRHAVFVGDLRMQARPQLPLPTASL